MLRLMLWIFIRIIQIDDHINICQSMKYWVIFIQTTPSTENEFRSLEFIEISISKFELEVRIIIDISFKHIVHGISNFIQDANKLSSFLFYVYIVNSSWILTQQFVV